MLKFFFAGYPGLFLFSLRILGGLFIYKSQWLYGGSAQAGRIPRASLSHCPRRLRRSGASSPANPCRITTT